MWLVTQWYSEYVGSSTRVHVKRYNTVVIYNISYNILEYRGDRLMWVDTHAVLVSLLEYSTT
jgi:hypothetical protein